MQTKTIALVVLIAIAIGVIGIAIETGTQSAQAFPRFGFGGNDNTQGNDNSGGNENTGFNSQNR